jgi:hypothetical protein
MGWRETITAIGLMAMHLAYFGAAVFLMTGQA